MDGRANSIATVVSTRVLRLHIVVLMAGVLSLVGALSGTAVAKTISEDILDPQAVTLATVGAAVPAASLWRSARGSRRAGCMRSTPKGRRSP